MVDVQVNFLAVGVCHIHINVLLLLLCVLNEKKTTSAHKRRVNAEQYWTVRIDDTYRWMKKKNASKHFLIYFPTKLIDLFVNNAANNTANVEAIYSVIEYHSVWRRNAAGRPVHRENHHKGVDSNEKIYIRVLRIHATELWKKKSLIQFYVLVSGTLAADKGPQRRKK